MERPGDDEGLRERRRAAGSNQRSQSPTSGSNVYAPPAPWDTPPPVQSLAPPPMAPPHGYYQPMIPSHGHQPAMQSSSASSSMPAPRPHISDPYAYPGPFPINVGYVPSAPPAPIGNFHVSDAARQAERMGISTSPSKGAPEIRDTAAMKEQYRKLYNQRENIQKEIDAIKEKLTKDEYEALVKDIEKQQLGILKRI